MSGALLAVTSRAAKSFEMIIMSRVLVGINAGMSFIILNIYVDTCSHALHFKLEYKQNIRQWSTNKSAGIQNVCCVFAGISMNVQPMYFGESAPKHLRGAISLSSAVFTAFGVVLGQVVGLRYAHGALFFLQNWQIPSVLKMNNRCHWLGIYSNSFMYLFIERFWAVSRVGSIFLPVMPFLASFSSSPCLGSQRAPDTCSLTGATRRLVLMVHTVIIQTMVKCTLQCHLKCFSQGISYFLLPVKIIKKRNMFTSLHFWALVRFYI